MLFCQHDGSRTERRPYRSDALAWKSALQVIYRRNDAIRLVQAETDTFSGRFAMRLQIDE